MDFEECCLITNGRCPYEIDNKCTLYGSKRPYGKPLCEMEELKYKNEEEFKITKEGVEEFLILFSNALKHKK